MLVTNKKYTVIMSTMGDPRIGESLSSLLSNNIDGDVVVIIDKPDFDISSILDGKILSDPRLIISKNVVNIGITKSLNKAIGLSTGEIIIRCDDDDISETSRIEHIIDFFDKNPDIDLAYSFAEGIETTTNKKWLIDGPLEDAQIKEKLLNRNFIVHSSLAFRRASLERIGFYDETFRYAQDYDLYLRCMTSGLKFGAIPKILVKRYYHNQSITVSKRKTQIMFSMAGRILYEARTDGSGILQVILNYSRLLLIPNWLRALRRKIGFGK